MRKQKERALRDDLEIVRSALIDEGSIAHMKDWKNWAIAGAMIALMFAWLRLAAWAVTGL